MRYIPFFILIWSSTLYAAVFDLPPDKSALVGDIQNFTTRSNQDTFPQIAQQYNVTFTGLMEANSDINPMKPGKHVEITVPSAYILPAVPHKGVVINLAELRLYYYPPHSHQVYTYPVGIGVTGWNIEPGIFKIIQKKQNPVWTATPSTREELKRRGYDIPESIPPGPDNPLGAYMMRLSNWTYLIHGVVDPATVGRRSSSGCFRMYNNNVEELFGLVALKTPVRIINEPYKVGWVDNTLYLEAHLPLEEQQEAANNDLPGLVEAIDAAIGKKVVNVDWSRAYAVAREHLGIPQPIGTRD